MSSSRRSNRTTMQRLAIITATFAIVIPILAAVQAGAQSNKGATSRPTSSGTGTSYSSSPAPSPVAQLRQQQQTGQSFRPTTAATAASPKRRQQQQQPTSYSRPAGGSEAPAAATEDPLSDSEPALYGSVAGQPGVDFPAYTRIPKTSFTCEGKGFDFGFYADEEAACQVYHVCWSGRRESFLCGVGTVFNQAILACDYWHSVDCSKSSQFYGVNSELGKASAEPASGGSQRIQPARTQASLPTPALGSSSSSLGASAPSTSSNPNVGTNFGEPINPRRTGSQQAVVQQQQQQQQQQQYTTDDSNFDLPQQQQVQAPTTYKSVDRQQPAVTSQPASAASFGATFVPQRSQTSYDYQQRTIHANDSPVKTVSQRTPTAQVPLTTSAPPPPPPVKRPRFNMDFNQKVNSLIDSPVRPPIKAAKQPQPQQQAQKQANYAQQAVNRAQQGGSQSLNSGFSRKGPNNQVNYPQQQQRQEPPQQQQTYDNELDEPQQQQQQQQTFDDSPVQTSTVQTASYNGGQRNQMGGQNQLPSFVPQQAIQTIRAGNPNDGSTSITTQYDTLGPASGSGPNPDQSYESNLDDQSNSSLNDDFRSSGARAAASQNQNWYIMRSI